MKTFMADLEIRKRRNILYKKPFPLKLLFLLYFSAFLLLGSLLKVSLLFNPPLNLYIFLALIFLVGLSICFIIILDFSFLIIFVEFYFYNCWQPFFYKFIFSFLFII